MPGGLWLEGLANRMTRIDRATLSVALAAAKENAVARTHLLSALITSNCP